MRRKRKKRVMVKAHPQLLWILDSFSAARNISQMQMLQLHSFLQIETTRGGQTEFAAGTGMGQGEGLRDVTDEIEVGRLESILDLHGFRRFVALAVLSHSLHSSLHIITHHYTSLHIITHHYYPTQCDTFDQTAS